MVPLPKKVKPKPDEYHTLTPNLTIKGADQAIEWYTKVLGAKLRSRMATPDGRGVWHAELQIGDSVLMLNDENPEMGVRAPQSPDASSYAIHVYLDNVDDVFQRAVAAGAKPKMPLMDMFWGDRYGQLIDPFGHVWSLAQHTVDVPPSEMEKRGRDWAAKVAAERR
jgi:PhnB protein